jgi:RNA polymerase sigma-70 factor (ECF subfamily)
MSNVSQFKLASSNNLVATNGSSFVTNDEMNLLLSAIAGDAVAFENLVMPHRDSILRVVHRILRNREDAEDAVQAAFLHALRHIDSFRGRSRFSSWLTRIAINAALMHLRAKRRYLETSIDEMAQGDEHHRTIDLVETRPNPEQACAAKEIRAVFDKAMDRLGSDHVKVLQMRIAKGMSVDEVARALEVPTGTVKARLHRARQALTRQVRSKVMSRTLVLKRQELRLRRAVSTTSAYFPQVASQAVQVNVRSGRPQSEKVLPGTM